MARRWRPSLGVPQPWKILLLMSLLDSWMGLKAVRWHLRLKLSNSHLEIHNCLRDFNINWLNNHDNIKRSEKSIGDLFHVCHKEIPLTIELSILIETCLHHTTTIRFTRSFRIAHARSTRWHFHESCDALINRSNLHHILGNFRCSTKRLYKCSCSNKWSFHLNGKFVGYIAKWLELLHIFANTCQISMRVGKRLNLLII